MLSNSLMRRDDQLAFLDILVKEKRHEKTHIRQALKLNKYPSKFVHDFTSRPARIDTTDEPRPNATVILPYVAGTSEAIRKVLQKKNLRVYFKTTNTLKQQLVHPKDPIPKDLQPGAIYSIPCGSCDQVYIGETGRTLKKRTSEHQRDTDSGNTHVWQNQHDIDWDNTKILDMNTKWSERKFMEAWHIHSTPDNFNRDKGVDIPPEWNRLFKRTSDQVN
ncbi:uncharacterized protein [Amphiura filiformis]|uniref:uncharacterized protein n=1 Tax=Amphiura filiformis TaxID=82378 RepID=UPI003B20BE75